MSAAPKLVCALALACIAGCASVHSPGPGLRDVDPIKAAFVVVGDAGQRIARVISEASMCPSIDVDGRAMAMQLRAAPQTLPLRPTRSAAFDSKPSAFPVRVCDFALPAGSARASVDGHAFALPKRWPARIVVVGDSGCRLEVSNGTFQACNDPDAWPFAQVAAAAAAIRPDLVIHVGDYHYRENACPTGNAGCAGSPWGYGWDAWNADFFVPARPLLDAAPWIFVRGNTSRAIAPGRAGGACSTGALR